MAKLSTDKRQAFKVSEALPAEDALDFVLGVVFDGSLSIAIETLNRNRADAFTNWRPDSVVVDGKEKRKNPTDLDCANRAKLAGALLPAADAAMALVDAFDKASQSLAVAGMHGLRGWETAFNSWTDWAATKGQTAEIRTLRADVKPLVEVGVKYGLPVAQAAFAALENPSAEWDFIETEIKRRTPDPVEPPKTKDTAKKDGRKVITS